MGNHPRIMPEAGEEAAGEAEAEEEGMEEKSPSLWDSERGPCIVFILADVGTVAVDEARDVERECAWDDDEDDDEDSCVIEEETDCVVGAAVDVVDEGVGCCGRDSSGRRSR